jgi:hypothetical protein
MMEFPTHCPQQLFSKKQKMVSLNTEQVKLQIKREKNKTQALYELGCIHSVSGEVNKSARCFELAIQSSSMITSDAYKHIGDFFFEIGKNVDAIIAYEKAISLDKSMHEIHHRLSRLLLPGADYMEVLGNLHQMLCPKSYVEIGVQTGASLKLAQCISIGIDPEPDISHALGSLTKVYRATSDAFFARHNLIKELMGQTVDLAFIDGLHLFEQALKDFINIEKYSHSRTVICIHDCLPLDKFTSLRDRSTQFWTGDPWKLVLILKEYRPDLTISTIPTYPSGLAIVTNLNPNSKVLLDKYELIKSKYMQTDWIVDKSRRYKDLSVGENSLDYVKALLSPASQNVDLSKQ